MRSLDEEEPAEVRARFSRRAALLGLGQLGLFGALGLRLHQLQVTDGNRYALLADENRILAFENAWNSAEQRKDTRVLDELLSNSLAYTDYDGTFCTPS